MPQLVEGLLRASATQKKSAFSRHLAEANLLVLDDSGLAPMSDEFKRAPTCARAGSAGDRR